SIFTFKVFASHALQVRDPSKVDWQAHFTAAVVLNVSAFLVTLAAAGVLARTKTFGAAAEPLVGAAFIFLIDIPSTLRMTMVQSEHDWARYRTLLGLGNLMGAATAIAIAEMGGGVWALVVPPLLLIAPSAADLVFVVQWRPNWSWSWARYREVLKFGLNRMGSALLVTLRGSIQQFLMAGTFSFAVLGVF